MAEVASDDVTVVKILPPLAPFPHGTGRRASLGASLCAYGALQIRMLAVARFRPRAKAARISSGRDTTGLDNTARHQGQTNNTDVPQDYSQRPRVPAREVRRGLQDLAFRRPAAADRRC